METKSEMTKAANGAAIEVVTVTFEGRDYRNLGSVDDRAYGFVAGYVSEDGTRLQRADKTDMGIALQHVSSWPVRSYMGGTMHAYRATIGGKTYSGRGFGPQMLLRLSCRGRTR